MSQATGQRLAAQLAAGRGRESPARCASVGQRRVDEDLVVGVAAAQARRDAGTGSGMQGRRGGRRSERTLGIDGPSAPAPGVAACAASSSRIAGVASQRSRPSHASPASSGRAAASRKTSQSSDDLGVDHEPRRWRCRRGRLGMRVFTRVACCAGMRAEYNGRLFGDFAARLCLKLRVAHAPGPRGRARARRRACDFRARRPLAMSPGSHQRKPTVLCLPSTSSCATAVRSKP